MKSNNGPKYLGIVLTFIFLMFTSYRLTMPEIVYVEQSALQIAEVQDNTIVNQTSDSLYDKAKNKLAVIGIILLLVIIGIIFGLAGGIEITAVCWVIALIIGVLAYLL